MQFHKISLPTARGEILGGGECQKPKFLKEPKYKITALENLQKGGGFIKPLQGWMSISWTNTTEESTSHFHHIFGQYDTHTTWSNQA